MSSKIAKKVALRIYQRRYANRNLTAYEAQGDLHKMIGKIISRQFGITNAEEDFFFKVEGAFTQALADAGVEMDLKDPNVYPYLRRAINEVADSEGLIK